MKLFIVLLTGAFMLATGTSDVFAKKKEKVQTEAKSDTVRTASKKRNTQYPRLFKNKRVVTKKGAAISLSGVSRGAEEPLN